MDVQRSQKHNKEHRRSWLLWHFFEIYRCQLELSQLHSARATFTFSSSTFYLQFLLKNFPFLSCVKNSLEVSQEWNGCRGLATLRVRAFQTGLRWSIHIKQKNPAGVNSEVKSSDYKSSLHLVEQLGTHYKEREILVLFKLVSSSPLPPVRPELLSAGYHPVSSLRCTFRVAKCHQQNDL